MVGKSEFMAKIAEKRPEKPRLIAKPVIAMQYEIVNVLASGNLKEDTDKIVLHCQHPDATGLIQMSSVRYKRKGKIVEGAMWHKLDDNGMIDFESAEAYFLRHYKLSEMEEVEGKTIETLRDKPESYLVIKAY